MGRSHRDNSGRIPGRSGESKFAKSLSLGCWIPISTIGSAGAEFLRVATNLRSSVPLTELAVTLAWEPGRWPCPDGTWIDWAGNFHVGVHGWWSQGTEHCSQSRVAWKRGKGRTAQRCQSLESESELAVGDHRKPGKGTAV